MHTFEDYMQRARTAARLSRFTPRPFGIDPRFPDGIDPERPFGAHTDSPQGYEPELGHLLDRLVPDDGVFLDVGANYGHFSLYVSGRRGFRGEVHAFEPVASTFGRLQSLVKQFGRDGFVHCHKEAVSDVVGVAHIETHPTDPGQNRINESKVYGEEVRTAPLDAHQFARVDFIKIDVEGHEAKALAGARALIEKHKPFIYLESTPDTADPESAFAPLRFLEACGYELFLPNWLQSDGQLHPAGVGSDTERHTLALTPCLASDRPSFPNYPWAPVNLFACPKDSRAAAGWTSSEALAETDAAIKGKEDASLLAFRAMIHRFGGEIEEAIADFEHAAQLSPRDLSIEVAKNLALGDRALAAGDTRGALTCYDAARKLQSPESSHLVRRCLILRMDANDLEGALRDANALVELQPREPRWIIERANLQERLGRLNDARRDYEQAIELTVPAPGLDGKSGPPPRLDLRRALARVLARLGDTAGARKARLSMIDLAQGVDKHRFAAEMHLDEGDYDAALQSLRQGLAAAPQDANLLCYCVMAQSRLGNFAAALDAATAVVDIGPGEPANYIQRAGVFEALNQWDAALADYEKAVALAPQEHAFQARLHDAKSRHARAR